MSHLSLSTTYTRQSPYNAFGADKPVALTWRPTLNCQYKCAYCRSRAPAMPELDAGGIQEVVEVLDETFDLAFWCILGGDVTTWYDKKTPWGDNQLLWFVDLLSKRNIFYGITSNSALLYEQPKVIGELMDRGLTNWSVSIDPNIFVPNEKDKERILKSNMGSIVIPKLKKAGVKDIHVTVTADGSSFHKLPALVRVLSGYKVHIEITPLIYGKNEYYDFAPSKEVCEKLGILFRWHHARRVGEIMDELIQMKREGYLIHNSDANLKAWQKHVVGLDWRCNFMWNLSVESDGALSPCLQLRGNRLRKVYAGSLYKQNWGEVMEMWRADQEEQCRGCLWDCQWESEYVYGLGGQEAINDYFAHGIKEVERCAESLA